MFSFLKRKQTEFFLPEEKQKILSAIKTAEQRTSGEVRVFVESRCRFVDAIDRAYEIFGGLKMQQTQLHNAVLVYVALKDKQLAVFADEGIYKKAGSEFWNSEVKTMLSRFHKKNYAEGISQVVLEIGEVLSTHFPYDSSTDKNELPDDIVFGK